MTSHIISARPSSGKSYIATMIAVNLLKEGKKVFSNYPIIYSIPYTIRERITNMFYFFLFLIKYIRSLIYKTDRPKYTPIVKKQLSTYKWKDSYVEVGLHDCTIILDEAYKLVNCHDKLTDNQHEFFATTGHNNLDIFIIAQNYARINLVIREMAMFMIINKFSNPLSLMSKSGRKELTPLFFTIDYYLSERDYALKGVNPHAIYETKRHLFNIDIANAYNTQYYRKREKPISVLTWLEDMKLQQNEIEEEFKKEFIKE